MAQLTITDAVLDAHLLEQQRDYLMDLFRRMSVVIGEEEITPMHPFIREIYRMTKEGMFFQEHHTYKDLVAPLV